MRRMLAILACTMAGVVMAADPVPPDHAARMAASQELFKAQVRTLLTEHCLECHGGAKVKSEFDLTTREALLKGGSRGVAVVPGKGRTSMLVKLVTREDEPHMPPKKPLPKEAAELLVKWIDLGAAYDRPLIESKAGPKSKTLLVTEKDRDYWAYRPLKAMPLPTVKTNGWARTEIDRWILSKLEAKEITPAAEADRRTLIRRVTFDLTGLPPTPAEIDAFVADTSPNAYEKVVDRLLASPQFGERWGRHWLDPARFAESHGFEHDYFRPHAYHYRDFVIRAFNADMPYDRFVQWQLAGDELAPNEPDALAATGFLGAGVYPTQITNREAERVRYDAMDDMLSTTGHAMLALTIGCARCHDHKYDPIPTKDYYRLLSAFTTTVRSEIEVDLGTPAEKAAMAHWETKRKPLTEAVSTFEAKELPAKLTAWVKKQVEDKANPPATKDGNVTAGLKALFAGTALDKLPKPQKDAVLKWYAATDADWKKLDQAVKDHDKAKPKDTKTKIQACTEGRKPMRHHTADGSIPDFYPETFQLTRGDVAQKVGPASPGVLQVLARSGSPDSPLMVEKPKDATTSFRRAALARWMTDTQTGAGSLAARVIVNRLWHYHFGRGIVSTLNDFGFQGEPPTHPELLDWMANDLITHGWQLKRLHKMIVMSKVYMLSGTPSESAKRLDPDNKLWSHRPRRRLEAEAIRDNLLAVGGLLDLNQFGPGTLDQNMRRRSIYFTVQRSQLIPMLQVFDWPDTLTSAGARPTTVVAPQALLFLNAPQVKACAEGLANRIKGETDVTARITQAYRYALGRPPTSAEIDLGKAFLASRESAGKGDRALAEFALALLSVNEFIYVD